MKKQRIAGKAKRHPDGFGFFIPDDKEHPDVYIPKIYMDGIMSNDRVEIEVTQERGRDRLRGKIVKLLERSFSKVTGQIIIHNESKGKAILLDKSHSWGQDLILKLDPEFDIKNKDWVVAEVVSYPGHPKGFTGKIIENIGSSVDPNNDNLRILYSHDIPVKFSKETLKMAQAFPDEVQEADKKNRIDLRKKNFVTIDGATAKDFDDAVMVESNAKGFLLYVAIADVSHYVKRGDAIDKDAHDRGTSTYFPNFVNPMLPMELSHGLCSLMPKVDRLALVAEIQMDYQGNTLNHKFYEAVICSQARVTYGAAQEIIEGRSIKEFEHVEADILRAADLSKVLMAKRFKNGSLNLEIPETEVKVDEAGNVVDILKTERVFAHKLIEELMLKANISVAEFFEQKNADGVYRIHEEPKPDNLTKLEGYLESFGYNQGVRGGSIQKKITKALAHFAGGPKEHILSMLTLRTMNQAKYDTGNTGHFGLSFSDYTHFTSPIRRFPDLLVHRQLKALVKVPGYGLYSEEDLNSSCTWLSACEQRSVKAERQLISVKKANFMKSFLGDEFEGTISSIAKFGIFVQLREYDVDGLIRLDSLKGDRYTYNEDQLQLVGQRSGHTYSIGDSMKIQVAAVDSEQGRIDFVLAGDDTKKEAQPGARPRKKKKNHKGKKKKTGNKKSAKTSKKSGGSKKRNKAKKDSRSVRKARVSKSSRTS